MSNYISFILSMIDPDIVGARVERPNQVIRENYVLRNILPKSFSEFKAEIIRYYQYHWKHWAKQDRVLATDIAFGNTIQILDNKYNGGHELAAKNSIRGREGGLISVLDAIAEGIQAQGIDAYISNVLSDHINPLDFDQKVEFARQYLETYSEVLLGEDHISAHQLASDLESTLRYHANWIKSYKQRLQ